MDQTVTTFSSFYDEHFAQLVRVLRPIARDAAEDIAQDAFTALYRNWDEVGHYDVPFAWVRLVAVRAAFRRSQRETTRARLTMQACRRVWHDEYPLDVAAAVERLPRRQAVAVAMHHIQDRPVTEVADALQCSGGAARVLLHRSRRQLAAQLGGFNGRWISERQWTTDQVVGNLRATGHIQHADVIVDQHLRSCGGRWVLELTDQQYRLSRDDGLRLDDGSFRLLGRQLVLEPTSFDGAVVLETQVDGNRLTAAVTVDTTPPTDGVPDHVWMELFLGSGPFVWAGRNGAP